MRTIKLFLRFFSAFCRSSWAEFRGFEVLASLDAQKRRLDVCMPCEWRQEDQCLKCGCLIYAKTALALEECPIEKWKREKLARSSKNNDC